MATEYLITGLVLNSFLFSALSLHFQYVQCGSWRGVFLLLRREWPSAILGAVLGFATVASVLLMYAATEFKYRANQIES